MEGVKGWSVGGGGFKLFLFVGVCSSHTVGSVSGTAQEQNEERREEVKPFLNELVPLQATRVQCTSLFLHL